MDSQLQEYRSQIDALDDQIIALLKSRIRIVEKVGALKSEHAPGKCPMRPGREAMQMRRIIKEFEGSAFLPEAVVHIWRIIISASLAVEGKLRVVVCSTEENPDLYWLTREYFGSFTTITREPGVKRILGCIIDGKADIGIMPMIRSGEASPWWLELTRHGENWPKIFARIPFAEHSRGPADRASALAIGRIAAEVSGDDLTYLSLETEDNTSMHKLQSAFTAAKIEARWVDVLTQANGERHHCIELKGFFNHESPAFREFIVPLGGAIIRYAFLGAYATPITLSHEIQRHD